MSLKGKTAFITGGGKNLGALVAREFAAEGANLALHYNSAKTQAEADQLVTELNKAYPSQQIKMYQADLTTGSSVNKIYSDILKDFSKLDILVNTAGMVLKKPLVDITEDEYDVMFAVNSKAAFLVTQQAAKHLQDNGSIINIVTGLLGAYCGGYTAYQGSKAPVEWFTKGLSKEISDRGINVNSIAPGPMDTPFFYGQETPESVAFLKSQGMGGRLTKIEDIAPVVKFLATEGKWISGQVLFASGGFTTR